MSANDIGRVPAARYVMRDACCVFTGYVTREVFFEVTYWPGIFQVCKIWKYFGFAQCLVWESVWQLRGEPL